MNEQFKKFKSKMLRHAIIESVVAGLVAGLIVVAAILLPVSLSFIEINVGIYIGAGLGAAVLAGGITFLIVRPGDKKAARRLDKDLALNEKIQTMVAYSSSQDSMAVIQRDDASGRLASAGTGAVRFKRLWINIAAAAVALALFVSSVVVAVLVRPAPVAAEEYSPTLTRVNQLYDLISYVENNNRFSDESKDVMTEQIYNIIYLIYDEETQTPLTVTADELLEVASASMLNIDAAVEGMINADVFGLAFSEAATALGENEAYSAEYTMLYDMGMHIASLTNDTTLQEFSDIKNRIFADATDPVPAEIALYAQMIASCAQAAGEGDNADLYAAFTKLSGDLSNISQYQAGSGENASAFAERVNADINNVVDEATVAVSNVVSSQAGIRSDGRYVIYRIQAILEISDEDMPELSEVINDVQSEEEGPGEGDVNEDDPPGGGGETIFPGDDVIYGYSEEDDAYGYYQYGEIIDGYEGTANAYGDEGMLTDEYIAFLHRFYNLIRNGTVTGQT